MPWHRGPTGRSIGPLNRARRVFLIFCLVAAPVIAGSPDPAVAAPPRWVQRIEDVVGNDPVSVVIGYQGQALYRHKDWVSRAPASNQKLLLSMALLDRLDPATKIPTRVLATDPVSPNGILHGNLWIVGHGDPEVGAPDIKQLAAALKARGLDRVRGRVMGATGPFKRDWFAPGWRDYFPTYYIALPTALTYRDNRGPGGRTIVDPERRAAAALTKQLRAHGIKVSGKPGMGPAPSRLNGLTTIQSDPLIQIMHRMNVVSSNFRAEVLGKYLGARVRGAPGSIAKGAKSIETYLRSQDLVAEANDASGLSYANRVSADTIARALWAADASLWGEALRNTLARGGQGTLEDRLKDVRLRAKTGTLIDISALSGWVWLEREDAWAQFSILSKGIHKTESIHIENVIVRVVSANAAPR
jgi:serine-type D-Ala-D-Ala carboxypeptidase/endopeptidase (penicillin-binding protein 4)